MATILVIEDEAVLLAEVVEWLTFEGHDAIEAADGQIGVTLATFYQPDLILCDITLPKVDGYALLLAVRANTDTAGIPFIFMTERATHADFRKGMDLGADDYITKPFGRLELLSAIDARLSKREKQREEYEQEMELLQHALVELHNKHMLQEKLLSMFSHDFSGPLTSILLTSNLLQLNEHRLDAEARKQYLDRINTSVRLLQQMLEDIRLITHIEQGDLALELETIVPSSFLQRILQVSTALYPDKYKIVLDVGQDEEFEADSRLLRQIANNLINNAMKYSAGGSEIQIAFYRTEEQIHFSVQDEGIGIPKRDRKRLFEAFQRGSNVKEINGTGLGLAIVKQAVELHQGTIALESKVGVGTKVTVSLPILTDVS